MGNRMKELSLLKMTAAGPQTPGGEREGDRPNPSISFKFAFFQLQPRYLPLGLNPTNITFSSLIMIGHNTKKVNIHPHSPFSIHAGCRTFLSALF